MPTSVPTYRKMAMAPSLKFLKSHGDLSMCELSLPFISGLLIGRKERIKNVAANTPIAMKSTMFTSTIFVCEDTVPISEPTSIGVSVPAREFSVPPIRLSWLPLLPPPPRRLIIGFTTVLSIHTANPHTNAPAR